MDPTPLLVPPLEFDLGSNPGKVRFETFEDADKWIAVEFTAWNEAAEALRKNRVLYDPVFSKQQKSLSRLANAANQARQLMVQGRPWEPQFRDGLTQYMTDFASNAARSKPLCIHSQSAPGRRIVALATAGQASANGVLAWETGFNVPVQVPSGNPVDLTPMTEGIVTALRDNFLLTPDIASLGESLSGLVKEWEGRVAELRNLYETESTRTHEAEKNFENRHFRLNRTAIAGLKRLRDDHKKEVKEHKDGMIAIRTSFNEQMKLRGPVDYWSTKRGHHVTAAAIFAALFVASAVVSVLVIFHSAVPEVDSMIAAAGQVTPSGESAGPSTYMTHIRLLIEIGIPAFFGFWILRVVSRLFHMNIVGMADAGERVTMAKTYLALFDEKKLSEPDRILILNALFRPTSQTPDESPPPNWFDILMQRMKP